MALLNAAFDATAVAPAEPLEVLPPGRYLAQIVESEMLPTKAGDGQYLKLVMEVLEGPHARRKIFDQLNLVNRNEQTVYIAQRHLSAICHAVGQIQVTDSEQLHFRPLAVTLKVEPAGLDRYGVHREARNKVSGYSAANPAPVASAPRPPATARPASAPPAAPPARPGAAAAPPWRRNG